MNGLIRKAGSRIARLFPRRPYPVLAGPLRGARFILGSFAGDGGGASVFFNLSEQEQLSAFAGVLKPGYCVLDIGANVGFYSVLAAKKIAPNGRVFAFEPVRRNADFLRRHIAINGADNILVIESACGRESGETVFFSGPNAAMGSLCPVGGSSFRVEVVSIDDFVESRNIQPDVMKIDVEGAEYDVICGAEKTIGQFRPVIFLSTHSAELRRNCLERLSEMKYAYRPLTAGDDPHEFVLIHGEKAKLPTL